MVKQNWFPTLNSALEAEGLVELWPMGLNISYGENVRFTVEISPAVGRKRAKYRLISVYRNTNGMYERPVNYMC